MKITRYAKIKTEYYIIKRFDTSVCRGEKVSNIRREFVLTCNVASQRDYLNTLNLLRIILDGRSNNTTIMLHAHMYKV